MTSIYLGDVKISKTSNERTERKVITLSAQWSCNGVSISLFEPEFKRNIRWTWLKDYKGHSYSHPTHSRPPPHPTHTIIHVPWDIRKKNMMKKNPRDWDWKRERHTHASTPRFLLLRLKLSFLLSWQGEKIIERLSGWSKRLIKGFDGEWSTCLATLRRREMKISESVIVCREVHFFLLYPPRVAQARKMSGETDKCASTIQWWRGTWLTVHSRKMKKRLGERNKC